MARHKEKNHKKSGFASVRLPIATKRLLEDMADDGRRSLSSLILIIIEDHLAKHAPRRLDPEEK
jgi:hypothetical protein